MSILILIKNINTYSVYQSNNRGLLLFISFHYSQRKGKSVNKVNDNIKINNTRISKLKIHFVAGYKTQVAFHRSVYISLCY